MLEIGSVKLDSNVLLAPMSGVTDLPFRKLVKSFGASLLISEMIASRAMIIQTRESLKKCQNFCGRNQIPSVVAESIFQQSSVV